MNRTYFILGLISMLSFGACKEEKKPTNMQQSYVMSDKMLSTTQTAEVKMENLRNQLNFYGKITTDNNKMVEVYPIVGGNVTKVYVELGDYVQKGQLLATIRSTEVAGFEKEKTDAEYEVELAKKNVSSAANLLRSKETTDSFIVDAAKKKLQVAKDMYGSKLGTDKDVTLAKEDLINTERNLLAGRLEAQKQVDAAKLELDKAETQLKRIKETYSIYNMKSGAIYEVRAPIGGFVIEKKINQDMTLRNDRTDNIFDIAEINDVWAIANVNESDIGLVKLGIDAEVTTLSYPDKKFYGKVDKIYNIIDPETKAMKARIKLDNKDFLLKPEMRATIQLSYQEQTQMLAIPSAALIFDKSKTFVMIFKDRNNIETRQVSLFRQVGETAYISSGLNVGEKVITTNQLLVYDALND